VIVQQYYLGCLAHASYLIGDEQSGGAAVVDPQRDVDQYLRDARRLGLRIRHVFLTHLHADFIAGHVELREQAGATIYLGARAQAEYEFVPVGDGETIDLGPGVRLEVLETPGHSPESISILVYDAARAAASPYAVLTGETLFVGDVGRPDLRAALGWSAEELGGLQLPRDRPLVVHCATGYRSAIAASILLATGFESVADLVGGLAAWTSSNLDVACADAG
jgi:glyoxylase-like metal-dependent hydrolase (beta-lactamase superfamily II)